jgi:hypothetical protein
VRGIVAGETPVITATLARSVERTQSSTSWAAAKRIYSFLENRRLPARVLKEGLYRCAQATIEEEDPDYLVVALDPVNFEKPYTHDESEGVSTVHKSTPPDRRGKARLARGYPAMTATVVNTRVPATTYYANWFSYTTGFISENREIHRAIGTTGYLFPRRRVRFVGNSGLDDQKIFEWMGQEEEEEEEEEAVRTLVLLSDVAVANTDDARALYADWRLKGRIEHGYRFCQEAGLDVEDMRVRSLERMRRLFVLVLLAMQFVMHLMERWPKEPVKKSISAKSRFQKAKSDPNFAHFSDRIAVIYDATSTF